MLGRHHVSSGIALGTMMVSVPTIAGISIVEHHPNSALGHTAFNWLHHWFTSMHNMSFLSWVGTLLVGGLVFVIGTLLPDIDSPTSSISRMAHTRHIRWPFPHRTITHSIWPLLACLIASPAIPWLLWLAAGMATHIFLDALSTGGVCWIWPITRYHRGPGGTHVNRHHMVRLYRVGTKKETALNNMIILLAVVLGVIALIMAITHRSWFI
ncbi:metal-dependent hydrolase [Bifidobacterium magnum]|uniref:Membrane-bound metal-dependent hydrolase n=1 Tax=Bifidobacterium magnum TaxID=1692 RepID=A0A087BEQ1_9BIFI|nr:metal-dependent hydrolase [Bifidobacterium magnum]KFI69501.1 hypothetical protein BMAGN_1210 [Bifidobacterium magnum]